MYINIMMTKHHKILIVVKAAGAVIVTPIVIRKVRLPPEHLAQLQSCKLKKASYGSPGKTRGTLQKDLLGFRILVLRFRVQGFWLRR